jgi:ribosomal protein L22
LTFSNEKMHKRKNAQSSNAQNSNAQASNTQTSNTQTSNAQTSSVHAQTSSFNVGDTSSPASDIPISENSSKRLRRVDGNEFDIDSLEYDPGLRPQIWEYDVNYRDEIRRAYIRAGPYRPTVKDYPKSGKENHLRSFQPSWYNLFPSWLEYSLKKDAAFCLPCFLFNKPSGHFTQRVFTIDGYRNWKKVRNGKDCAFLNHIGKDPNSFHRIAEKAYEDLKNQSQHIQNVFEKLTSEQIANNRLQLKASIDVVRVLAFQGIAFRGRDESVSSTNRGNFLEILDLPISYSKKLAEVVAKAPKNATYTSPKVQKQILHVFSTKVKEIIRNEIGDTKFCLIVDEARDESMKEQMSIVLRFVDKNGFVRERFFGLVHVSDTAALTLKKCIYSVLSKHQLDIQNIRRHGYDGASNMRGGWNGLQALVSNDCPYAYYIHCFAHRLQLALVAASKEVISVHQFFTNLNSVVNFVCASCNRYEDLRVAQADENAYLIEIGEIESGSGLNQISTLQRAGDMRWSSHLRSVSNLIKIFSPACEVILKVIDVGTTSSQRAEADSVYQVMTSFEFVFILHLMKETMQITDHLCQALQSKSQDILSAMGLVSSTKTCIQRYRDDKWELLLTKVKSFCNTRNIDVPDMNARYVERRGRARHQQDDFTIEHHYRVDIFYAAIDLYIYIYIYIYI